MTTRFAAVVLSAFMAAASGFAAAAFENAKPNGHWVSAWGATMHAPLQFPGMDAPSTFENQTIRMVVRPTLSGERVRIRFSNEFGKSALVLGAAHVALVSQGAKIAPESDHVLTFGGKGSVSIPPGAPILSDPVDLKVTRLAEVAVTIFLPNKATGDTAHFWAQHETYVSAPGDFTAKAEIPNATTAKSAYWLADLEVWSSDQSTATVAFGDSITDGVGAKQGEYADWPDALANRLSGEQGSPMMAVINEGMGGNRILHDGAGVSALARFNRDVLAQPGVTNLIILEGINDIGWPLLKPRAAQAGANPADSRPGPYAAEVVSAQEMITGLLQLVERAHEHGIRVFGGTLTPYEGAPYYSADGETKRETVNQWIRTSGVFDGVFDFDAVVRDPDHPTRFRENYQSGDHLHPSAIGYKAMADSIDLSLLRTAAGPATQ